jgi:uncharacterized membrane protein
MGRDHRGNARVLAHPDWCSKPMKSMKQTDLLRYERTDNLRSESHSSKKRAPSEEEGIESNPKGDEASLNPDEATILRYVREKGSTTREELCYRSRLAEDHLKEILDLLDQRELIDVKSGNTVVQIRPRSGRSQ